MRSTATPVILDGRELAARRAAGIRSRAGAVRARRGRAPTLLLLAFQDRSGRTPHVGGKLRACEELGIVAIPVLVPEAAGTEQVVDALRHETAAHRPDGLFVQVPFPRGVDGDAVLAAVPPELDVDVMTPQRIGDYMSGRSDKPPVTVTAAVLLLDAYDLELEGRRGVIVAEPSPFSAMFAEALHRRGVIMREPIDPRTADLPEAMHDADLVIVAAGGAGLVDSRAIPAGAIAIDAGYYNPSGRGDIDTTGGVAHLQAIMPVPGGIGPMTVSALLERLVESAA